MSTPVVHRLSDFEPWVESSPQPVAVLRWTDGLVVAANAAFLSLVDVPRAVLVGQAHASANVAPPADERQRMGFALAQGSRAGRFVIGLRTKGGLRQTLAAAAHLVDLEGTPHLVLMPGGPEHGSDAPSPSLAALHYVEQAAPLGTWEWDLATGRTRWSAGMEALYGIPEGSFEGGYEHFTRFLHPADAQRVDDGWRASVAKRAPLSTDFRIVRPDGCVRWMLARAETVFAADGTTLGARGMNMDVTDDRRREHRLRLSEAIINNMAEAVVLCSTRDGLIVYASPRYEAMLGYEPGELQGRHGSIVNSPAEGDPLETAYRIMAEMRRAGAWAGTVRNRRKDGRDIWVRVSITTFDHDDYGPVWLNVHTDITEAYLAQEAREQAAADLRRLSASVQETIEAERSALSRDLHDQLGAALAAMRLRLEAVASSLPGTASTQRAEILGIARMAQDATVQTREICSRLRPPALDDLGIVETLRWYLGDWAAHTGLRVKRRLPRLQHEPAPGVAIDVFRILQELLTNVARHARASSVTVRLQGTAHRLVLRVGDDGVGIAPHQADRGFGLLGVRERAQRHGGGVVIDSGPGGTAVTVTIPRGSPP